MNPLNETEALKIAYFMDYDPQDTPDAPMRPQLPSPMVSRQWSKVLRDGTGWLGLVFQLCHLLPVGFCAQPLNSLPPYIILSSRLWR